MYHAIFLEELTTLELVEKIASLYSISPQHIHRLYRQGPTGIHVLVSNEVSTGPCPAEPARGSAGLGGDFSLEMGFTRLPPALSSRVCRESLERGV